MEKNKKISMSISVLIFLAVVAFLVFITINKEENPATLQNMEAEQKNMQITQQVEGVKITILQEGNGETAKPGNTVAMNYTGRLADGAVFDSNVDSKFSHVEPFIFTIGAGGGIRGWDIGVAGMKEGEKRILEINPDYAYGSAGAGGVIPPNATITFEVELLQIKK